MLKKPRPEDEPKGWDALAVAVGLFLLTGSGLMVYHRFHKR